MTNYYFFRKSVFDFDYIFSDFIKNFKELESFISFYHFNDLRSFFALIHSLSTLEHKQISYAAYSVLNEKYLNTHYAIDLKKAYGMLYRRIYYVYFTLFFRFSELSIQDFIYLAEQIESTKSSNFHRFKKGY